MILVNVNRNGRQARVVCEYCKRKSLPVTIADTSAEQLGMAFKAAKARGWTSALVHQRTPTGRLKKRGGFAEHYFCRRCGRNK